MMQKYTSFFSLLFGAAIAWLPLSALASGVELNSTGCFVRVENSQEDKFTIRMQSPDCSIDINNTNPDSTKVIVTVENIDPDFVTISAYDTLKKYKNSVKITYTAPNGTSSINLTPWHEYTDTFSFIALSDNQARGTIDVNPVFEQMVRDINQLNPVFYTNSGDLIQGSSDPGIVDQMYTAVIDYLGEENISPMYPIAGNHDSVSSSNINLFKNYFGVDNYSFDFANTHFAGLSTVTLGDSRASVATNDITWITNDLNSSTKTHKLAFFHHPLLAPDWATQAHCCYINESERNNLAQVIDEQNVHTIITGHSHGYDFRYLTNTDIPTVHKGFYQLITGGAGGQLAQPDGKHHFVIMNVTPTDITHTVVNQEDFATFVDYSNNNGTNTSPVARVVNEDDQAMQYVRLKFKVKSDLDSYVVSDSQGNYYNSFYYHEFPEYTVIYLETTAPANSDITYYAKPAGILHKHRRNIIKRNGQVTYSRYPDSAKTEVNGFSAAPIKKTTKISNIRWGNASQNFLRSWLEQPQVRKFNTTYTINSLPPNSRYNVYVNKKFYNRFSADINGSVSFVYTPNVAKRHFKVKTLDTTYSNDIAVIPQSDGTPHLRIFKPDGSPVVSWFSLNSTIVGSYQLARADMDLDNRLDYIVYTQSGTDNQLGIFNASGQSIGTAKTYGLGVTGIEVAAANLGADPRPEIITVPLKGNNKLKVYRYMDSQSIKSIASKKIGNNRSTPVRFIARDLDNNGKAEIITLGNNSKNPLLQVHKLKKDALKTVIKFRLAQTYDHATLTAGDVNGDGNLEVIVVTTGSDGDQLMIYSVQKKSLALIAQQKLDTKMSAEKALITMDLDNSNREVIVLHGQKGSQVLGYQLESTNKISQVFETYPFGQDYTGPLSVSYTNSDNSKNAQLVTGNDSHVRVWNYNGADKSFKKIATWLAYDKNFSGGINIAE